MLLSLNIFKYYFLAWLTNIFVTHPQNAKQYASKNLFQPTFRIPQSERSSIILVLKYYFILTKAFLLKSMPANFLRLESIKRNEKVVFVFDVNADAFQERKKYVEYFTNDLISGGVFKEGLFFVKKRTELFLFLILNFIWLPFLLTHSLFKKDKAPMAMLFREQLECFNLINIFNENKVDLIYHFSIYEKDSNINTLILNKYNIKVNKIPSEVPIGIWNKTIIANKLCLCMGYQNDEINSLKSSIFVDDIVMFGPENCLLNIEKYKQPVATEKNTIGFYSTGAWIRKLENHNNQGYDMEEKEENVKKILNDFCRQNPKYKLYIFLHPREKWEKYNQLTKDRYKMVFPDIQYHLSDKNINSSLAFEKVDIGIAFQSTIVYERLYYGFKTLIMPTDGKLFPVEGSNMKNICSYNKEQLYSQIEKNISKTNTEFFETNGIRHFAQYLYN